MTDRTGLDVVWRVSWVELDGTEHTEIKPLYAACVLVGELMGRGVQVIGVHDNAIWLSLRLDDAELASISKSPYADTQF